MKPTKENTDILKKLGFVNCGDGDWTHKKTGWGIFIENIVSFPWLVERLQAWGKEQGYQSAIDRMKIHLETIEDPEDYD